MPTLTIEAIFTKLLNNEDISTLDITLQEKYFFYKAHKLADQIHFINYWNDGRSKSLLQDILAAFYPPQTYCNSLEEAITNPGFEPLARYYTIACRIFNR